MKKPDLCGASVLLWVLALGCSRQEGEATRKETPPARAPLIQDADAGRGPGYDRMRPLAERYASRLLPQGPLQKLELAEGHREASFVTVFPGGACCRVIASSLKGSKAYQVLLKSNTGSVVQRALADASGVTVLGLEDPLCPAEGGAFQVRVEAQGKQVSSLVAQVFCSP